VPQHSGFTDDTEAVEDVPVWVSIFGPCGNIGRALGLCVDLPDLVDEATTAALWKKPGNTWKDTFEGRVADTMRDGDDDWMQLAVYEFGTGFYDREEGVKFHTKVGSLAECLQFIVSLADKGVKLCDRDYMEDFAGEFGSCVWVMQASYRNGLHAYPTFESLGLVRFRPTGGPWVMPPNWRPPPTVGQSTTSSSYEHPLS
jgi:hypothetical protein